MTQSGGGNEPQLEPGTHYSDGNKICVEWY
jgi:hypothetical protein